MKVTLVSKELIVPSVPTPLELETYKLSYIDQQISPRHISFILYYSYDKSNSITQSKMTIKLKTSLSKTLTHFYPLAGRLSKCKNSVDCMDQGVQFLVTQVESNILDIVENPIMEELNKLVRVESSSYVDEQLAIQVNLFNCGGIAVGVSISHRIADACSFSSFVSHWFTMTKGLESPFTRPILDSAILFPSIDSHEFIQNSKNRTIHTQLKNLSAKRFVFSSIAINRLKSNVVKDDNTLVNPTRVEVVTALIWKCATAVLCDSKASVACHVVNFRRKMVPSLHDHQFGNLFQVASAVADQTADMTSLVAKLRRSFGKINNEYLKSLMGENGAEIAKGNYREMRNYMSQGDARVFLFSSWCKFGFSECDFGWEKPVWFSGANFSTENSILLTDSRWENGIEAWVVMNEDDMQKFEDNAELQAFVGSLAN